MKYYLLEISVLTTQEYFVRTQKHWFPTAEKYIAICCITYLSFSVFETGYCHSDGELEQWLRRHKFYNYAANSWGHHARGTLAECKDAMEFLNKEPNFEASSQALFADWNLPKHAIIAKNSRDK